MYFGPGMGLLHKVDFGSQKQHFPLRFEKNKNDYKGVQTVDWANERGYENFVSVVLHVIYYTNWYMLDPSPVHATLVTFFKHIEQIFVTCYSLSLSLTRKLMKNPVHQNAKHVSATLSVSLCISWCLPGYEKTTHRFLWTFHDIMLNSVWKTDKVRSPISMCIRFN